MSSPITLSNFNGIDFGVILNLVMTQASRPLTTLQSRQTDLTTESNNYNTLATKIGSLETAAAGLSSSSAVTASAATVSDTNALAVSETSDPVAGTYDVVVKNLALAQVTASSSTAPDADTTAVATGGTITIGGVAVGLSGSVTLQGLASKINATSGMPVTASVVQSAPGSFRLVLTSAETGLANAFTVTNGLTGGTGVSFTDTDADGVSGDSALDNAQQALDASVKVNGLEITSASNTLTSGIPGVTLSLLHADLAKTVTVTVSPDDASLVTSVKSFVSAYNDLMAFVSAQSQAAAGGDKGTLAHEAIVQAARSALRASLGGSYGSGTFRKLAEVGIGYNRTGQLTLATSTLTGALSQDRASVVALFAGTGTVKGYTNGAFGTLQAALHDFTSSGGFISAAQTRLLAQESRLNNQIRDMQDRLAVQRAQLQAEYMAADQAMTTLRAQSASLSASSSNQSANSLMTNG
jgi:flagellar hook-associated protein 2